MTVSTVVIPAVPEEWGAGSQCRNETASALLCILQRATDRLHQKAERERERERE